jgi:DNA-binding CsgD family transcriptional regulator
MRKCIHLILSHSNRVTAAVAMFNAGIPMETIASCLCGSVESVKHYLRECTTKIGFLTEKAIQGAMMT